MPPTKTTLKLALCCFGPKEAYTAITAKKTDTHLEDVINMTSDAQAEPVRSIDILCQTSPSRGVSEKSKRR